jgi:iron complex transport system ATP-binding protein
MSQSTTSPHALSARHLCVSLGHTQVLHDISLSLPAGCWTSVVGPNGAGKSTLLKALAGVLPSQGDMTLLGQPAASWSRRARAQQLAWLGQNQHGGDDLSVYDVVLLGRLPHQAWLSAPSEQDAAAVRDALQATQAWEWRTRALGQLSGGERQRVLLARALAVNASVLLMDEPLANLDPPHQADWLDVVHRLVARGVTVVSVLHELTMALHADHMVIMNKGRITHQGSCASTDTHAALTQVFDERIAIHVLNGQWVAMPKRAGM